MLGSVRGAPLREKIVPMRKGRLAILVFCAIAAAAGCNRGSPEPGLRRTPTPGPYRPLPTPKPPLPESGRPTPRPELPR